MVNYTNNHMIPFHHALDLIDQNSQEVSNEVIQTKNSYTRILTEQLISPSDVPPFNNSAMDGIAVNSKKLQDASTKQPQKLPLIGITAAGEEQGHALETPHSAWKIMTGAPLPAGYDSVIPIEQVIIENNTVDNQSVLITTQPTTGQHVRKLGQDFKQGEVIASKGQLISPNLVMAMAATGIADVSVKRKLSIAFFSTGKELVDNPRQKLLPGQIRNSNKAYVASFLQSLPIDFFDAGTNLDNQEKFEHDLKKQISSNRDIIISTGAVSMGDFDFIPQIIQKLGGEIIFHKCTIRPGKPILFAKFNNGSYFFGLPGNPISTNIGLRFFVSRLITNLLGVEPEKPIKAILKNTFNKKKGFRFFMKSQAQVNSNAKFSVTILDGQESFKIKPLLAANGWSVLGESDETLAENSLVDFYPSEFLLT